MTIQHKKLTPEDLKSIQVLQRLTPSRNWTEIELKGFLENDWVQGFGTWKENELIGICILKVLEAEVEVLELAIDKNHQKKVHAQRL